MSEMQIPVKNLATMSKLYEDTCRFLADVIEEVGYLCVMLRNFCDEFKHLSVKRCVVSYMYSKICVGICHKQM